MIKRRILLCLLVLSISAGLGLTVVSVHPATDPAWPVLLDAQSTGATDASPQTSLSPAKTFNVGIILEANSTTPMTGVFGWEVSIIYDNTTVVPQGDPTAGSAADAAANTVTFGAMTGTGQVSWAGKIAGAAGFGSSAIVPVDSTHKEIQVFFTTIAPATAVTIGPAVVSSTVRGNLLANVAFEIISRPSAGLPFSIDLTNTAFVDSLAHPITVILAGPPVTETITNAPPVASFTANRIPANDPSCMPITGANCSAFAVRFDGSASSDTDGTITAPTGYFWDFGDGVQDNALSATNQGAVAVHDFGLAGSSVVTLRVVDDKGETGSARDALGGVIVNNQPSHTQQTVNLLDPTTIGIVCAPSSINVGGTSTCTATVTDTSTSPTAPTGTVAFTTSGLGTIFTSPCSLLNPTANSASCDVTYSPTTAGTGIHTVAASYSGDSTHDVSSGTFDVTITTPFDFSLSTPSPGSLTVVQGATSPLSSITATLSSGTATSVTFSGSGLPSGVTASFTNNPCSPTCTVTVTFSATGTAALGPKTVTLTATGGGATHSVALSLTVAAPAFDFSLSSPSPGGLTVVQGSSSSSSSIIATLTSGTGSSITFTASGLPSGITASFANNPCTPTCTVNVSFDATSTATLGTATVTIDASGGGASHSTTLLLTVNAPAFDFSLSIPSPGTLTVVQGATSPSSSLTATLTQGISAPVTFSTSTLPSGVTASFTTNPCEPTCSVTVTFSATSTVTTGTTAITITATGGGATHTTTLSLTVAAAFDFSLSTPSPGSLAVVRGQTSSTSSITATLVSGTASSVTFSTSGLPSGVTAAFGNNPCTPTCTVTVSFTATATATTGTATITITATGGGASHTTNLSLTVNPAVVPDFSISAGAVSPAQILAGGSGSSTITLNAVNGFTGTVDLSIINLTSTTCTLIPSVTFGTSPQTATLSCTTAVQVGDFAVAVTGTSESISHTTSDIVFHVTDYSVGPSVPTTVNTTSGVAGSQTITVTAVRGFTGTVDLSASASSPSGLTCTLPSSVTFGTSPKTASLSCLATVTSDTDFTVTVTGTSGTLSHSTAAITFHVTAVAVPDFSISAGPVSPSQIVRGGSGDSIITVTALNGYTGTVNFNASPSFPNGVTCSNPSPVTFGSSPQTVTLTCTSTGIGDTSVRFEARDSVNTNLVHITLIVFHVVDFTISPDTPVTVTGNSGSPITQTITIDALNALTGTVNLSASASSPSGLTCNIAPSVTFGSTPQTATLSCTGTVTTVTDFVVTITAALDTLSHATASITFQISPAAAFEFSLSTPSPSTLTIVQGSLSSPSSVTATLVSGTTTPVTFTLQFLPLNVHFSTATTNPCSPTCDFTFVLDAAGSTPLGTFTVRIDATGGGVTHSTTLSLTITAPTVFGFSLSTPLPNSLTVVRGNTSPSSSVHVTLVSGTSTDVTFTASGLPSGVTAIFNNSPCSPDCTVAFSFSALSSAALGTVTVTIDASGGGASHSTTLSLTVSSAANAPPIARFTESTTTALTGTVISFDASGSSDSDGTITSYAWDFGDGTTATGVTTAHAYSTPGSYTVTLTVTDNDGASSQATATKVITSPSANRYVLRFNAFDADQYVNGVGELDVKINGHLVVNIPGGLLHLTGSGSYAPYNERWVAFGPFDISSFVIPGANILTFTNPLDDHASLLRNVTITLNEQPLFSFQRTSQIYPGHGLRLVFPSQPLVFTGLTAAPSIIVQGQPVTLTATYTGGVGPFTCTFRFGDDDSARVTTTSQSCSASHTYDDSDTFNVRVTIRDSTGNTVNGRITITVHDDSVNTDATALLVSVTKPVGKPNEQTRAFRHA